MWLRVALAGLVCGWAAGSGRYVLPSLHDRLHAHRRPIVDKDLAHYFQPTDTTGRVVSGLFNGFLPQPAFEVQESAPAAQDPTQAFLQQLASAGVLPNQPNLPGIGVPQGFAQGNPQAFPGQGNPFSAQGNQFPGQDNPFDVTIRRKPGGKSTSGIPDIDPNELNLPSYPVPGGGGFNNFPRQSGGQQPVVGGGASLSNLPKIPDSPPPPPAGTFGSGGGSPFDSPFDSGTPGSFGSFGSGAAFPGDSDSAAGIPTETGPPPGAPSTKRLMSDILGLFGAKDLLDQAPPQAPPPPGLNSAGAPFRDIAGFGPFTSLLDSLTGSGPASALTGIIPSAIYEGITAPQQDGTNSTNATAAAPQLNEKSLKKNIGLIQELIMQPNSPFCNPKPRPLASFNVDAFMGTWFQVFYSPPMSAGPCSMITYRKMEEKGQGGAGTLFSTFEYTTDGNSGSPDISSGFALLRGPGQLIYKTGTSRSDVTVQVVEAGPLNGAGQYEWVVLSVNCNYPLHVFARDPVVYEQRYAAQVNALLERRGLVDGFKRLLNIVAPVDHSQCRFPKAIFDPSLGSPALSSPLSRPFG